MQKENEVMWDVLEGESSMQRYGIKRLKSVCLGSLICGLTQIAEAQLSEGLNSNLPNSKLPESNSPKSSSPEASLTVLTNVFSGEFEMPLDDGTGFVLEYEWDYRGGYETEIVAQHQLVDGVDIYGGVHIESEMDSGLETFGIVGVTVSLPLDSEIDLKLASDGLVELEIGSTLSLTDDIEFAWAASTEDEYKVGLIYSLNEKMSLVVGWETELGWGGGVQLNF